MTVATSIDWTKIIMALIAALPAIIAAVYAGRIHRKIKTPSGTPIGKQVEDVRHTAIANNQQLVGAAEGAKKVAAELAAEKSARPAEQASNPGAREDVLQVPGIIPPGPGITQLQGGLPHPVGSTGGKGKPIAPKASGAWLKLAGQVGTHLPSALRQASIFRRNALRALK